ncbi:MAG: hypothetical protein RJB38_1552 [Pseudomonadota bacterium]|jgi:putative membrane protein
MRIVANGLVMVVASLHVWILILEMFLWRKPVGLKAFRNSPEKAEVTAALAANQGLYNGFLAAVLVASFMVADSVVSFAFQVYGLSCVILAGLYGAWSVSPRIFWIQAFPAALALVFVVLTRSV